MIATLIATFPMTCRNCRRPIGVGAPFQRLASAKGSYHPNCVDKIAIPQKSETGISQFVKQAIITPPASLNVPQNLSYLPYQEEGIRVMLTRNSTLLADEMGLGKTIQAIGYLNQCPTIRTVAIVTPTSLRLNWRIELKTWLTREALRVIGLFPESEISSLDIAIIPYSFLNAVPESYKPELLIVDEAQFIKNPDAQRTGALKRLAQRSIKKLFLTGSPIENRVKELWTLLQMLDPDTWDPPGLSKGVMVRAGEGAGWIRFAKRHCGGRLVTHIHKKGKTSKHFVFDGSTHLEELNKKLRETVMIRRMKNEVLKDLPEKRRQLIVLPKPIDDVALNAEHEAFAKSGLNYASDLSVLHKASIEFSELAAARKASGIAKIPAIVQLINDCFENGVKALVVFAHHKEVVWQLQYEFLACDPAVYTGDCNEEMRHNAVTRFQSGKTPLFLGTIGAAGVGITLSRASTGIFAEIDWKDMSQAEDRLHRIGQKQSVLWIYPVFDWSVDANMIKLVWTKRGIVEKAINER